MKTDRKSNAEKSPTTTKTVKSTRRVLPKTNGKHPLAAYEHIPVGIVETSLEGKYLNVNEEFCRILGYSREELLQLGIKDCTHEDDYGIDSKLHEQLVAGKIPFYRLEKRFVRKSGGMIWVELTRTLVCDAKGKPLYTMGVVLDISDRKDVEKVLRESVERLRLATETARMFMWEWDFQNYSYILADNFEQVIGFSANLLSKNSFETLGRVIPVEDVQAVSNAFENAVENQMDLHSIPCRVINPETGQLVWLEVSAKIVYDHEGKPERMFGVAQNITESKKTQDEIAIISRMPAENPNPVMRLTPDGRVLYANSSSMVILESWEQQGDQPIPAELQKLLVEAFRLGIKKEIEITQNGKTFSCVLAPIPEAGYVNFYGTDITGRKEAEKKLRESEERFRALVSQATAGIAQSDMESRLVLVNPRFCEMLGYSEEELLGKTIWELTYAEDLEENKGFFQRMISEGESYQFEKRFIRKDGSILWTSVSVSTIRDLNGDPKGGVGVVLDINKRKQADESLTEFARQQEALYQLSDRLHRTASLQDVFDASLDAILNALQCDRASILLFDDKDVMRFVAWRGLSDRYRKATDGHSPWKPDAKDPEPICMDDVRTADLSDSLRSIILEEGIGSLAFIPLVSNGNLVGKFMVYFNTPHTFDEGEVDLGLTIAHQLAFGIDRNRADEKIQRLNRELQAQLDEMNSLLEILPTGVWIGNEDCSEITGNAAAYQMLGLPSGINVSVTNPEPQTPQGMRLFVNDEEVNPENSPMQSVARTGTPMHNFEHEIRFQDGTSKTMYASIVPLFDQERTVRKVIGTYTDITERKQAEKRLTLLTEISELLRNVEDPYELMYTISKTVGEHLHVKRVLFNEIDLEQDLEIVHNDYHNGLESVAGAHKISEYSSVTSAEVAAGKTVVNMDSKTDPRTAREYEKTYALSGERSYVAVPMMRDNRWVASLWVSDDAPRSWTSEEVSLLETVAERTWTVIEKLRINAELRQSEERLRATLETTVVGFATLATDTRFVEVNDAFCRIVGYSRQELLARDCSALTHPDFIESTSNHVAQLLAGEVSSFVLEKVYVRKDGVQIWVQNSVSLMRGADGRPLSLLVICQDVTERKFMEEQLRVREAELEEVINHTPFMLTRCSRDLRYRFVSRAYAEMIGRTPEEVAGKPILEVMGAEGLRTISPYVEKVLAGERVEYETEVSFQDVGAPVLHVIYTPDRDEQGNVIGWFASIVDITERKRMEEALRIENERFMQFVNSNIVGILIGNSSGEVILANDYYLRLLGVSRQDLTEGKVDWKKFTPPEWRPADEKAIQELREHGVCEPYEKEYLRADGTRVPVYIVNALLPGSGEEIAAFVIDITERKRAQEALRESEQRYRFIVENTSDGIWWIELTKPMPISLSEDEQLKWYYEQAVIRQCNLGLARMYGYQSVEEVIGLPLRVVMPRENPVNLELSRRFIRSGYRLVDSESHEVASDGRELVFLNNMIGIIEDGKLAGEWGTNRDITQRKHAEEALRASETLYRAIARNIPGGGVYVVDKDFRYLVAEGPVTEAFGLKREMLEGHTVSEVFPGERAERMEERLKRNFAGETVSFETEHKGRVYWTQQAPLHDSIGQAIILTIDITERKQAEEALRQSEERFARFMRHLPGLAWIKDMQGRYVYANAAAEQAFNTPRERLYGKTDEDIFPPEVAAQFRRNDEQALRDEKGVQVVETLEHAQGVLHYSLVSKFPIPGPDGETTLIGGTSFDITERLQAEEALRESEERFRAILRQATAGIVRKDPEGRLIFVNEAFCNMLGYTESELLGKTVWDFMHKADVEENKRSYDRLMMEGIPFKLERRLLRGDGSVIWVDASVSPIMDAANKPQSAVAVEVDITGRKLAEEALRVSEERYRNLFELIPVAVYSCDADGLIQEYNYRAVELWGREPKQNDPGERYCGSFKIFYPDGSFMPHAQCPMARALNGETIQPHELEILVEREDGMRRNVIAHPLILKNEQSEIIGAINCLYDITERKQAEEALRELNLQLESRVQQRTAWLNDAIQTLRDEIAERRKVEDALRKSEAAARENEEKLSTLFELLPVGISFLDPEGQIIQMNSALANILKLSKEQLLAQEYLSRKYIRPNGTLMSPAEFASRRALEEEKTIYNVETGIVLETSEVIWTSVSAAPVNVADVGAVVVTADITESKRAERALQESRERLQILSQRLVEVQEDERRAIARELHDRVGQTLAALNINLIIISGQLNDKVDAQISTRLSDSMKLVAETIALVRDVMSNLRPAVLDDYGLEAAIESYLSQYMSRYEIDAKFERPEPSIPRLVPSIEMTFLRIAQEALMNIARHAQASQVRLSLWREENAICMTIQDNGMGIVSWQEANRPGSHGLTIMRERAEAFGGSLRVSSIPGQGTKVDVRIPIEMNDPSEAQKEVRQ